MVRFNKECSEVKMVTRSEGFSQNPVRQRILKSSGLKRIET